MRFACHGQSVRYVVPADGTGPAALPFSAKAGDLVEVYVGDAKTPWASLCVGSPGVPGPAKDSGAPSLQPARGKLFVDGVEPTDPKQGDVGDCWIIAALSAIANTKPQALQSLIQERADGSYLVKLKGWDGHAFVSAAQTVPALLYASSGDLTYGGSTQQQELWPAIIERAYAQWKGSYDAIAVGYPYAAFEALLGVKGTHTPFVAASDEAIWQAALAAETKPTVAVTGIAGAYKANGLVEDHAYTVLGASEKNGERFVKLRNPWGQFEPKGNGPDDGVFELSLAEYKKFFVYSCAANI
jgi:hypothetical protein